MFVPVSVWAALDGCVENRKYANQYTVDKRCYVTAVQAAVEPYSAVVALVDGDSVYCTGTIVNIGNVFKQKKYVYTAKHCVANGKTGVVKDKITIRMQNGDYFYMKPFDYGDYDVVNDKATSEDWAIYELIPVSVDSRFKTTLYEKFSDTDWVSLSGKAKYSDNADASYNARLIGYGGLKIMSNAEINNFKNKYIKYLKDRKGIVSKGNEASYGWDKGGIKIRSVYPKEFMTYLQSEEKSYYNDVFYDGNKLKVSYCKYKTNGYHIVNVESACQMWSGNSGGGVFDDNGNLMAIHTRGFLTIGGSYHAKGAENINLLEAGGKPVADAIETIWEANKRSSLLLRSAY